MKFEIDLPEALIAELREALDALPLMPRDGERGYIQLVAKLLPQLPMVDPAPEPLATLETADGMKLSAYTPSGVSMLQALDNVLGKVLP